jgi:hypothetical protein
LNPCTFPHYYKNIYVWTYIFCSVRVIKIVFICMQIYGFTNNTLLFNCKEHIMQTAI